MSDDERDDDPDREAILARRRKLVAVALAGLTSAAACGDDAGIGPQPCLEMAPVPEETTLTPIDPPDGTETEPVVAQGGEDEEDDGEGQPGEGEEVNDPVPPVPQACLRIRPPPPPPPATPRACLDVAVPPEEPPRPQVCLTPRIDREREEG